MKKKTKTKKGFEYEVENTEGELVEAAKHRSTDEYKKQWEEELKEKKKKIEDDEKRRKLDEEEERKHQVRLLDRHNFIQQFGSHFKVSPCNKNPKPYDGIDLVIDINKNFIYDDDVIDPEIEPSTFQITNIKYLKRIKSFIIEGAAIKFDKEYQNEKRETEYDTDEEYSYYYSDEDEDKNEKKRFRDIKKFVISPINHKSLQTNGVTHKVTDSGINDFTWYLKCLPVQPETETEPEVEEQKSLYPKVVEDKPLVLLE